MAGAFLDAWASKCTETIQKQKDLNEVYYSRCARSKSDLGAKVAVDDMLEELCVYRIEWSGSYGAEQGSSIISESILRCFGLGCVRPAE